MRSVKRLFWSDQSEWAVVFKSHVHVDLRSWTCACGPLHTHTHIRTAVCSPLSACRYTHTLIDALQTIWGSVSCQRALCPANWIKQEQSNEFLIGPLYLLSCSLVPMWLRRRVTIHTSRGNVCNGNGHIKAVNVFYAPCVFCCYMWRVHMPLLVFSVDIDRMCWFMVFGLTSLFATSASACGWSDGLPHCLLSPSYS